MEAVHEVDGEHGGDTDERMYMMSLLYLVYPGGHPVEAVHEVDGGHGGDTDEARHLQLILAPLLYKNNNNKYYSQISGY